MGGRALNSRRLYLRHGRNLSKNLLGIWGRARMKRLVAAFAILVAFMAAPNLAHAQLNGDQQTALDAALSSGSAQAVADVLATATTPEAVAAIAQALVLGGNATLIATVLNAEAAKGGAGASTAISAISTALGQSSNTSLVSSVLGGLSGSTQANVAGSIKAAATAAGNTSVLNISTVSSATAPTQVVSFTPPPVLVVNPNQNNGSSS